MSTRLRSADDAAKFPGGKGCSMSPTPSSSRSPKTGSSGEPYAPLASTEMSRSGEPTAHRGDLEQVAAGCDLDLHRGDSGVGHPLHGGDESLGRVVQAEGDPCRYRPSGGPEVAPQGESRTSSPHNRHGLPAVLRMLALRRSADSWRVGPTPP